MTASSPSPTLLRRGTTTPISQANGSTTKRHSASPLRQRRYARSPTPIASAPIRVHVRNVNQPEEDAELDEDHWLNDLMSIEVTPDITSYGWKELVSVTP